MGSIAHSIQDLIQCLILQQHKIPMYQSQPQSPFLKHIPENQQSFFTKKITGLLQTDKQNILKENPQIQINKMIICQNQVDGYLVNVGQMVKIKKQTTRDIFKGLQKDNKTKRLVIGISGHKQLPQPKAKSILSLKPVNTQNNLLFNLNVLLKVKPQEFPYVSMFSCDCLMSILKLYLPKDSDLKQDDLRIKWRFDFVLKEEKIGQIMVLHETKGDQVFANISIRIKLTDITNDQLSFSRDLIHEFGSRLNISKNLRQSAYKIKQTYQSYLMFIGEEVSIKRKQPNQWQETVGGRFSRVNEIGNAILMNRQGMQEEIQDGYMELRESSEDLNEILEIQDEIVQIIEM